EIGKLWENLDRAPYKELFNASVSGLYLGRCVQIQRLIDRKLATYGSPADGRIYGVLIHGNRMISMLVFSKLDRSFLTDPTVTFDPSALEDRLKVYIGFGWWALTSSLLELYPSAILPTLFKKAAKCAQLYEKALPAFNLKVSAAS